MPQVRAALIGSEERIVLISHSALGDENKILYECVIFLITDLQRKGSTVLQCKMSEQKKIRVALCTISTILLTIL